MVRLEAAQSRCDRFDRPSRQLRNQSFRSRAPVELQYSDGFHLNMLVGVRDERSRGVEVCPASRGIDFAEQIKSGYTHGETRIKERIGGKFGDKNIVIVGRTPSLQQVTLRPAGRIVTFTPEHRPDSFERCRTDAGVVVLAR